MRNVFSRAQIYRYVVAKEPNRFAVALSGPNLLKFTDYMMECGIRLRNDAEFPSDRLILYMIDLHRIGDQIHDTFRSEDNALPVNENRLYLHLQLLQEELKRWESQIPGDLYHGGTKKSFRHCCMNKSDHWFHSTQ